MSRIIFAAGRPWQSLLRSCLDQLEGHGGPGKLGVVFLADPITEMADAIMAGLRERSGVAHWIGAGAGAIFAGSREIGSEGGIALCLLELAADSFRLFDLARADSDLGGLLPAIVHAPSDAAMSGGAIAALGRHPSGMAGGRSTSAFANAQLVDGATAGALTGMALGPDVPIYTDTTLSHLPLGAPVTVTSVAGARLVEIDNRPAFQVLAERAGELLARSPERLCATIRVAAVDSGIEPRPMRIVAVDPRAGTVDMESPPQARRLAVLRRDGGAALDDLGLLVPRLLQRVGAGPRPQLALYYASAGRGTALFGPGVAEAGLLQEALGDIPLIGMRTSEEIFNGRAQQHSGVLCLLG